MRFSVCVPMFFRKLPFPEAIQKIAALGYDAAEIWNWRDLDLSMAWTACEEYGVELMGMCTANFELTDPAKRSAFLSGLEESCAAAHQLGVKRLITQSGPDTGARREYQHGSMLEGLRAAVPILEANDITLMLEPLNTLVDHKTTYLWSSIEGFELTRAVGSPRIKILYDIYHQQIMEGNLIQNITENLDCIEHLHAAGVPGRYELQSGETDYRAVLRAVQEAGYTGACGLEYKPLLPPEESLKKALGDYM